jgi:hypothetical protein
MKCRNSTGTHGGSRTQSIGNEEAMGSCIGEGHATNIHGEKYCYYSHKRNREIIDFREWK